MYARGLRSRTVLRTCLKELAEAPVTVRVTVCPSAIGLERQGILNFMNECSFCAGSVRLSEVTLTETAASGSEKKLVRRSSQKKTRAARATETTQNLTNDFIALPPKSNEYAQRQVLAEAVPQDKLSGIQTGIRGKPESLAHDGLAEDGRESV